MGREGWENEEEGVVVDLHFCLSVSKVSCLFSFFLSCLLFRMWGLFVLIQWKLFSFSPFFLFFPLGPSIAFVPTY